MTGDLLKFDGHFSAILQTTRVYTKRRSLMRSGPDLPEVQDHRRETQFAGVVMHSQIIIDDNIANAHNILSAFVKVIRESSDLSCNSVAKTTLRCVLDRHEPAQK